MVRVVGVEPTLLAEPDFESGAALSAGLLRVSDPVDSDLNELLGVVADNTDIIVAEAIGSLS